jgi:hypothetical protein
MEDLGIEELTQLVVFYKQRASDLEFNLLQTQLKLNKAISLKAEELKSLNKTAPDKKTKQDS